MSGIVLTFGLEPGRNINARIAAVALLAWNDLVREAALAVDPRDRLVIELLPIERGSFRFPQILRYAEDAAKDVAEGAGDYPYLKKAALALATLTLGGFIGAIAQEALQDDVQKVRLIEMDPQVFGEQGAQQVEEMQRRIAEAPTVQAFMA
ncbi:MAG: hypothetical protein AVDCRST_MAG39-253 [uncultured Sphingomonadaceae bacterium]|uniref:Uncharacterized protein n=1 Tax=uncultured Sphingomonadaceae bacterium TaxID=169976 RepID=A0A6J4S3S0_9SPHN|nr:MAG: hypothetical protein AVDCRST_MAG39-253 [uncultured Sphingomonadaceae bacterium]